MSVLALFERATGYLANRGERISIAVDRGPYPSRACLDDPHSRSSDKPTGLALLDARHGAEPVNSWLPGFYADWMVGLLIQALVGTSAGVGRLVKRSG